MYVSQMNVVQYMIAVIEGLKKDIDERVELRSWWQTSGSNKTCLSLFCH